MQGPLTQSGEFSDALGWTFGHVGLQGLWGLSKATGYQTHGSPVVSDNTLHISAFGFRMVRYVFKWTGCPEIWNPMFSSRLAQSWHGGHLLPDAGVWPSPLAGSSVTQCGRVHQVLGLPRLAKCGGDSEHREAAFPCPPTAPCLPHQPEVRRLSQAQPAALSPGITASQLWHLGEVSSLTGSRFAYLSRGGDDGLSLRAVLLQGQDEMEQIQHLAGQMAIILIVIVSFKSNL